MRLFNNSNSLNRRRELRKQSTLAESILWGHLRTGLKNKNIKCRRQVGVGVYIVDFYLPSQKLVIEIDGDSHFENNAPKYDLERTKFLESKGLKVIRFTNNDVLESADNVFELILQHLP